MLTNTILVLLLTCSAQMVHKERGDKMDATIFVAFNKNIELDICINHACIGKITAQHFAILKANGDKKYTMEACLGDATPENGYKSTVVFSSEPFDHFTYHEEAQTINLEMY